MAKNLTSSTVSYILSSFFLVFWVLWKSCLFSVFFLISLKVLFSCLSYIAGDVNKM